MDTKKVPCFSINRYISLSIGLWPNDARTLRRIQKYTIAVILLSSFVPQIGALVKHRDSIYTCCRIIGALVLSIVYVIKYFHFAFDSKHKTRRTLEWIQRDWDTYTNLEEHEILEKHGRKGRSFVILHLIVAYPVLFICLMVTYAPWLYNHFMHQNQTNNMLKIPVILEYYVFDQNKHVHWMMLHMQTCYLLGTNALIATESINMLIIEHASALFELVSYYLNDAIEKTIVNSNKSIIERYIKTIVRTHYRALGFITFLNSCFTLHYVFILAIGVVTLSINLYVLADSITNSHNLEVFIVTGILLICEMLYLLVGTYLGQRIIDESATLFVTSYCTRWYLAPLPMQKFLRMFLGRCVRTSYLASCGVLKASFELLSSVLSMSMSYFMVLWSLS